MLRKVLFVLPLVLLLSGACTSGGEEPAARVAEDTPSASPTAVAKAAPTATEEPSEEAAPFVGMMNPLDLLGGSPPGAGAGTWASGEDVDPELSAALLQAEDLPPGHASFGPMSMSMELSGEELGLAGLEEGTLKMAMAYFYEGDTEGGHIGSMVASMVMVLPQEAMDEMTGSFEEFDQEALREAQEGMPGLMGMEFKELSALDASGLGEAGTGMHMVMNLGGMGLGEIPGGEFLAGDIAFDMYMFVRGRKALMLMTMWPGDEAPPVNSRSLAEVMDRRASGGF